MAQQHERPRPHGDPLGDAGEPNPARRQSDAPSDGGFSGLRDELTGTSDRADGKGSTANGVPEFDEASGERRRKQYEDGAELVSGMD